MRKQISSGWRKAVWGLAGLALLAFTPDAGAQASRAGVGGLSGGLGAGGGAGGSMSSGSGIGGGGGVSGGTGLSGGSASFSGGQALQGGLGNSNSVSGASASTYSPNSGGSIGRTGVMGNYFSNPYAMGLAYSGMTQSTFGQPLYNLQSISGAGASTGTVGGLGTRAGSVSGAISGSAGRVGGVGAGGGRVGMGAGGFGGGIGAGGFGMAGGMGMGMGMGSTAPMATSYAVQVAFAAPQPPMTGVRSDIQAVIDRSTRLPSRANIQVVTEGGTVVLRGMVASEHERAVAELTAKLTPGVLSLRNELAVRPPTGATARVP